MQHHNETKLTVGLDVTLVKGLPMPRHQLNDRQKRIVRSFLNAIRNKPDKTDWSYITMPSDDNGYDLAVVITIGIPVVDEIKDMHKSDLKRFQQIGLITLIPGRKAFRVKVGMIRRYAT